MIYIIFVGSNIKIYRKELIKVRSLETESRLNGKQNILIINHLEMQLYGMYLFGFMNID